MNKVIASFLAFTCLAGASHAQLYQPPPSSVMDGVVVTPAGVNLAAWQSSNLSNYQYNTGNLFQTPGVNASDIYGRVWTDQAPDKSLLNQSAGTLRLIFLGADSNWNGSIGYSYAGRPTSGAFTLSPSVASLSFGDQAAIQLGIGEPNNFDFWLSGGANTFCLFQLNNSIPSLPDGTVRWTRDPLLVSTYIPSLNTFQNVETWVASVDENTGDPSHPTLNYRVALQFFYLEGYGDPDPTPVPEPSTYGIVAGLVLVLHTFLKRRTRIIR